MQNNSKTVVTWVEVLLVLLLATVGMGICTAVAKTIERILTEHEPQEEQIEERHRIVDIRRKQAASEEEWKATLSLQIQQRLEVERQSSQIAALENTFPELRSAIPTIDSVPKGVQETYREAHQQKLAATLLEQRLAERLRHLRARLTTSEKTLRNASSAISRDLQAARAHLTWKRQLWKVVWWGAGLAVLLLAAFALLSSPTAHRAGVHRGPVLVTAALLLAILGLYELLGAALAAGFGGLLAVAGLWALLRSVSEEAPDG